MLIVPIHSHTLLKSTSTFIHFASWWCDPLVSKLRVRKSIRLTANESLPILSIVDAMYWPSNLENVWAKDMSRRRKKAQLKQFTIPKSISSDHLGSKEAKPNSDQLWSCIIYYISILCQASCQHPLSPRIIHHLLPMILWFIPIYPCCSMLFQLVSNSWCFANGSNPFGRLHLLFFTRSDEKTSGCSIHESLIPRVWSLDMSSVTPFFEAVKLESPPNIDMCSG